MPTNFISITDLSAVEIEDLLDLADDLKRRHKANETYEPLKGQTWAMFFEKPSLRTRVTFETGIFQLGGQPIFAETILGQRETIPDVARNLDRWVNGIVARTNSHGSLLELSEYSSCPVINALTDKFHPCQVLADAQTIREHKGTLDGVHVAFVGDGNNVAASWANLATRTPIHLTHVCPPGYELDAEFSERVQAQAEGRFRVCHDLEEGLKDVDVVYTDVWASMGQEDEQEKRARDLAAYQVNTRVMAMAKKDAVFMHCLPAHRGEEVTNDVIEGPQSIVFDEAENRLHSQKAVMATLAGGAG